MLFSNYSFNNQEKDDEVYGDGNSISFDARMLDSRLGRWLSVDPMTGKYASYSPYNFCLNNPVYYIDQFGKDVLPTPAFCASKYGKIYDNLILNSPSFVKLIEPYNKNRTLNYVLDINHEKAISGATPSGGGSFAATNPPGKKWSIFTNGQNKGKTVPNSLKLTRPTSTFYSDKLIEVQTQTWISDAGDVWSRTYSYSDIFIAASVIHESIHALVDYDEKDYYSYGEDHCHSLFNKYHEKFITALTEYVENNKLNYSKQDIEDLSWHGTEGSTQFHNHFEELAKKNGTTSEEEIEAWKTRKEKLAYDFSEPKKKD